MSSNCQCVESLANLVVITLVSGKLSSAELNAVKRHLEIFKRVRHPTGHSKTADSIDKPFG